MTEPDAFATYDSAYVLGALSPEDRAAYEEHLRDCDACSRAVAELAGLPGLLSQVMPDMVDPEPPPDRLLPALSRGVRRARRRRVVTTFGVAVAAAAAVLTAIFLPQPDDGGGTAMTPLGAFPVQARAAVAEVSGGSRVDMSCSYRGAYQGAGYLLVAVRADGSETELAMWNATPDRDARISVGTDLPPREIKALEIRTTSGVPLLRWHP